MDIIIIPILRAIIGILNFYQIIIFVNIVLSWLFMLGILDIYKHKILSNIFMFSRAITEPVYAFIRRFIPTFGPLDFSPIVVIIAIYILSDILVRIIYKINVMSMY